MSDEVVSTINKGIDITRACLEIILASAPPGDRAQIESIKQIMQHQALVAGDSDVSVALRVLFGVYQNYLAMIEATSPLTVASHAVLPPDQRKDN